MPDSTIAVEEFLRQISGPAASFDFCGIFGVAVREMTPDISERKQERIFAELNDMNALVKNEVDRFFISGIDRAVLGSNIHTISQSETGHVPVSRNPPERNTCA